MSLITVLCNGQTTSPIIWTSMTPWTNSAITTHITIPGGHGDGVNFSKGTDNAVTTLKGRVRWTTEGQQAFNRLASSRLTISNGIDTRTGLAGSPAVTDDNPAWIFFTISVTED